MSQGARLYDEAEVSEILELAGKGATSSDTFSQADLQKAAGELDIPADVVAKAVRRMLAKRQDEADRREFRRKELRPMLFLYPPLLALVGYWTWRDPFLLPNFLQMLAGLVLVIQQFASRQSWTMEKKFQEWRFRRVLRLAPDLFQDLVDPVLDRYFGSFTGIAPANSAAARIVSEFDMSFEAAMESLRSFLDRRPDLMARVDFSAPVQDYLI